MFVLSSDEGSVSLLGTDGFRMVLDTLEAPGAQEAKHVVRKKQLKQALALLADLFGPQVVLGSTDSGNLSIAGGVTRMVLRDVVPEINPEQLIGGLPAPDEAEASVAAAATTWNAWTTVMATAAERFKVTVADTVTFATSGGEGRAHVNEARVLEPDVSGFQYSGAGAAVIHSVYAKEAIAALVVGKKALKEDEESAAGDVDHDAYTNGGLIEAHVARYGPHATIAGMLFTSPLRKNRRVFIQGAKEVAPAQTTPVGATV